MRRTIRTLLTSFALTAVAACSIRDAACGPPARNAAESAANQTAATAAQPTAAQHFPIVILGDSLSAGLGLLSDEAYPTVLERKFSDEGYANVDIVNASVSGDTTAGGLQRATGVLEPGVKILVLALGGNDALRGLPASKTRDNLAEIIQAATANGTMVLLAGMEAPTNLGEDYQQAFHAAFLEVARTYREHVVYMPFLLEGVAGHPDLNQADGIHPNKQGAILVAEHMYPKLRLMVDSLGGGG